MKYSKSIFILMFINILTAFFLVFISHQSRYLEIKNKKLLSSIQETKNEININQIELTLHNDSKYLKKLYSIYNEDIEIKKTNKIYKLSEISKTDNKEILKVQYK
tara:strand:- start:7876 stop:8190 length:315 start_codon:yes stop_codon:yes gene_type:complete